MKKTLSIILTIIMLFSVCTVCASAAVNDAVLALKITPTSTSYKPGEEVTFEVSYEATSEIGKVGVCTLFVGYDSDVFEPVGDISTSPALNAYSGVILKGYALEPIVDPSLSFVQGNKELVAEDTAKGWDSVLKIAMTKAAGSSLIDASSETKVFAFKLKVKDTAATGNYAIGFTQSGVNDGQAFVDEEFGKINGPSGTDFGFTATKIFDLQDASVTVEGGTTPPPADEPTVAVENLDTKVRWATTEEDSRNNVLYVGFEGKLTGVSADKVSTIKEIGFKFSTSDKTLATATNVPTYVIYDFTAETADTYKFRSIVRRPLAKADIDGTVTHNIYAQAYVTIGDTTTPASKIIETTLQAQYAEGVANKMEDRFAQ